MRAGCRRNAPGDCDCHCRTDVHKFTDCCTNRSDRIGNQNVAHSNTHANPRFSAPHRATANADCPRDTDSHAATPTHTDQS